VYGHTSNECTTKAENNRYPYIGFTLKVRRMGVSIGTVHGAWIGCVASIGQGAGPEGCCCAVACCGVMLASPRPPGMSAESPAVKPV